MSVDVNIHTQTGLETYAQGMCNSAYDKARINEFLLPGTILEIGCGNGAYLQTLPEDRLSQTTAVDMSSMLLLKAYDNETLQERSNLVTFKRLNMLGEGFIEHFNGQQYDNIVFSSVLHEIYSEIWLLEKKRGITDNWAHSHTLMDMGVRLRKILSLLKEGGHLIIRDGLKPDDSIVNLQFNEIDLRNKFAKFTEDHPWYISYTHKAGEFTLRLSDAYEFLTKYFYEENWDIEVLERFGWCTSEELFSFFSSSTSIVYQESYLIPWLLDKWTKDFKLSCDFPNSTTLLVLQKNVLQ